MTLHCQFCSFSCSSGRQLLRHIFESHSAEPNFTYTCGVNGCPQTFQKYSTILSHIYRKHPGANFEGSSEETIVSTGSGVDDTGIDDTGVDDTGSDIDMISDQTQTCNSRALIQRPAALFLLTLKERYRLTQTAVDFAVGQVQEMVGYIAQDIKTSVESTLQQHCIETGVDPPDLTDCFENIDPFSGLETEYLQTKFYKENFHLVEPITVKLGSNVSSVGTGAKRSLSLECKDTFQYIPLLKGLQALLHNQEIRDEVFRPLSCSNDSIVDYCDGLLFKSHPLYQHHPDSLQLILYFDELEICNPIGAVRGVHKLGMFYYTLGNLPPELRATQRAIQLVACITTSNLEKYGFEAVLEPFIKEVNSLCKEGMSVSFDGRAATLFGTVLFVLADTLAAHQLGGFKVGVGFALRICRECMATKELIQSKFLEEEFQLRDSASYDHQCSLLDGLLSSEYSTTYGINYRSPLNKIEHFHVANSQLPQDLMHVLLEGVLPMEIKLMLNAFIYEKKYFSLALLNNRIGSFTYGRTEARTKPPKEIEPKHITGETKLPLSASQMWTFATLLPLFIGDKVPQEEPLWECYLLLLQTTKHCTARVTSAASAAYISALVEQHHCEFKQCYPEQRFTPKLHYMVHFPRQLLQSGPLITSWCMRMEAKNSYFKKIARIGNFKNIAYSVAKRHQRLMCCYLQGKFFSYNELQCGPCKASLIHSLSEDPLKHEILTEFPGTDPTTQVSRPNWIKIHGEEYHRSEFVHYGWQPDDLPEFGQITDILLVVGSPLLVVEKYVTEGLNNHLLSYLIVRSRHSFVLKLSTLLNPHVLSGHTYIGDGLFYIAMRSHAC